MGVVGLAWYISGVSALLVLMSSAISWAPPGPGLIGRALPALFGCGSILAAGVAIRLGRLPTSHWTRQSQSLRNVFIAAALAVTVVAALVG